MNDLLTTGPMVERFESELTLTTGAKGAVAVSSGTAALHCAYAAIGLGPGDEIITPPVTFVATQSTAMLLGAQVVFADVDSETALLEPSQTRNKITSRTRAIVAVDYAGHPAPMTELRKIADEAGVYLIEDAAHSLGSRHEDRPVGSLADLTTFSFFPTKNITTGEGGAVVSTDERLLGKARRFANQGLVRNPREFRIQGEGPWHQEVHSLGLNYRLSDINAAIGIEQLKQLEGFIHRRAAIKERYDQNFVISSELSVPVQTPSNSVAWHLYPLRVPKRRRKELFNHLREQGIGVQINYLPVYLHPHFQDLGYTPGLCPGAEDFYRREISLPMHVGLSDNEVDEVAGCVLEFMSRDSLGVSDEDFVS